MNATLLVVRAADTTKELARQATRILEDVNARVAGTVLNAVDFGRGRYGYRYYYGKRAGSEES